MDTERRFEKRKGKAINWMEGWIGSGHKHCAAAADDDAEAVAHLK